MPFLHKPSCINDRRDRDKYLLHNNRWTRAIRFSKSWRRWSNQQARVIPGWRFEFASLCACEHNFPPENTLWSHLRTPLSGVIYEQLNLTDAPSARCCRHFICSDRYCVNRSLVAWHRSAAHFHTFCSPFLCNIRKSVCYIHQCVYTVWPPYYKLKVHTEFIALWCFIQSFLRHSSFGTQLPRLPKVFSGCCSNPITWSFEFLPKHFLAHTDALTGWENLKGLPQIVISADVLTMCSAFTCHFNFSAEKECYT